MDDYELAYFAKFKLQTYMPETQLKIKKHLLKQGFTEERINQLIAINPKKEEKKGKMRCPRCSSDKIRTEKVEWTDTTNKIGYEDEIASMDGLTVKVTSKNQVICNVCEYWIEDPNSEKTNKSLWYHIYDTVFHIFTT
ncbi:hypothetical protein DZ858_04495 [Marixanthomonas ophiurae]|uniref:Uncharacterized protein n=1 Tax=Marixanthomonas ophiurae TaxID=387659 RepID=A0A3E1QB19_9FLAO|nr:hypothetical protein DZ858_04495 [Marixanthomonas ophiurae]